LRQTSPRPIAAAAAFVGIKTPTRGPSAPSQGARVSDVNRARALTSTRPSSDQIRDDVGKFPQAPPLHVTRTMPARFARPTATHQIIDLSAFDLSDTDGLDTDAHPRIEPLDLSSPGHEPRADKAADVLALCALYVFKDRRRRKTHGPGACALPGL
jgi:hypothetical protein